jgi:hypothetical protein
MPGVNGTVTSGNTTYNYLETSRGNNRGIDIWIKGTTSSKVEFEIRPNPHEADSRWYNKNQSQFYKDVAQAVANTVNGGPVPQSATVTVNGVAYTLATR